MEFGPDELLKDRYQIQEQLGKGGMGAVYLGLDTAVDRQVAVKVNLNDSPDAVKQFEREAKLLATLRHPNLPLVTDHFTRNEAQYLVMDYIPGTDLSTLVKSKGAQPLEDVLKWIKQLGSALSYLHAQQPPVVHRDIKPANIKLTPQGDVVLVDFGIAKASENTITTTGARGYTPGYAPPEQYGASSTGPYSDQFALAATMYALLLGRPPAESIDRMLGQKQLETPKDIDASIPDHIDHALQRALSVHPEDRFVNVQEFMAAMTDASFQPTIAARTRLSDTIEWRDAAPAADTKKSANPLATYGIIGGVIAVLVIGGALLFGGGADDPPPTQPVAVTDVQPAATEPAAAVNPPTDTPAPSEPTATDLPTDTPLPAATNTPTGQGGVIAFVSNRVDNRYYQVFTMNGDGSNLKQLTFDLTSKSSPAWSPDGTKLLYVADGGTDRFGNDLDLDIWMINADGSGEPVNITASPEDDWDPAWSPDGTQIAFTSYRQFDSRQVFVMNVDSDGLPTGDKPYNITAGYAAEFHPAWHPDGNQLAVAVSINRAEPKLFLRFNEAGVPSELFDIQDRVGRAEDPAFSPDGLYLAYTKLKDGLKEIWLAVFDKRGEQLIQMTSTINNSQPAWSPDGKLIVFTSYRDGNGEIYIMNVQNVFQTNLTNHDGDDKDPAWQPVP